MYLSLFFVFIYNFSFYLWYFHFGLRTFSLTTLGILAWWKRRGKKKRNLHFSRKTCSYPLFSGRIWHFAYLEITQNIKWRIILSISDMFTQKIYQTYEGRQNILNVSRQQNISNMCRQAKFVRIKSSGEVFYHYRAKVNKKIENVPFHDWL